MQIANYKANGELITSAGSGGGAPTDATYITQTANGSLSAEQALASLSTGLMKVTTTTGVVSSVTDSAGLAGCISDETGSGALVFGTGPTLGAPAIADFTSAQHDHGDADDGGLLPASSIGSGTLLHERGGLEADVSAYDGYIRIAGGATTNIKSTFNSSAAPTTGDDSGDGFAIGSRWLDTTNDKEYVALDVSVGAAVWVETTGGGGSGIATVQENGVNVVTSADLLDFKDFNVEDLTGGDAAVYHNLPSICEGRLTLTSGVPVTTSDVTAAGTLYFTPYKGNKVSLYDGTRWKVYTFTERSLALTLTSGSVYDVWLYDNAGTLTLETLVWTNTTTRATALASQDGVPVKSGATTRRYLGTICASGTNTTEDSLLKRFVWNYTHRVERKFRVIETTDNWSYTTASFRSWNNSTANRVEMVVGLSEEPVYLRFDGSMYTASAVTIALGIGLDSTTTEGSDINILMNPVNTVAPVVYTMAAYFDFPGIGYHYLQLLEYGNTGVTFYGDSGDASRSQNGALGYMRA